MLKLIEDVRAGVLNPRIFVGEEAAKRSCSLSLSKNKKFENRPAGRINWLDIDSQDERFVLSATSDASVCLYDMQHLVEHDASVANMVRSCKVGYGGATCVQWYPFDNGIFITGGVDRKVKLWDTKRFVAVEEYIFDGSVYQHDMSPKNYLIAVVGFGKEARLVDVKSGSSTHELRGHSANIRCCKWSPKEDNVLVTAGSDSKILIWDVRSSKNCLKSLDYINNIDNSESCRAHEGSINGLCFTHDGFYLLSVGNDNEMRLWNVFSGRCEFINFGHVKNKLRVQLAVTREARPTLVYVPTESHISIFNMETGELYNQLFGHFNSVTNCAYRSSYYHLITGGIDQNILVWCSERGQIPEMPIPKRVKDWNKKLQKTYRKRLWNSGSDSD